MANVPPPRGRAARPRAAPPVAGRSLKRVARRVADRPPYPFRPSPASVPPNPSGSREHQSSELLILGLTSSVSAAEVAAHWPVAVNLLAGSLLGTWVGATWAVRMRSSIMQLVRCLP